MWTNHVCHVNWRDQYAKGIMYDFVCTGRDINIPNMPQTAGGTILEAEKGELSNGKTNAHIKGFTGSGYVESPKINWTYTAENEGTYILEFRYGMKAWVKTNTTSVNVNNETKSLELFYTGDDNYWAVDKLIVKLKKGENQITFDGDNRIWLDNVNIIPFY